VLPVVWGNVTKGIAQTDRRLLQMARCYRFGAAKAVRYVYLPSVAPYFLAACTTGMGLAWKAGIAAEVLANAELSIGGRIYDSKIYMETTDLFAWTAVVVLMSAALEKLVLAGMAKAKEKLCGGGKADA
jgi:NitT/TauT family transport system permease protein